MEFLVIGGAVAASGPALFFAERIEEAVNKMMGADEPNPRQVRLISPEWANRTSQQRQQQRQRQRQRQLPAASESEASTELQSAKPAQEPTSVTSTPTPTIMTARDPTPKGDGWTDGTDVEAAAIRSHHRFGHAKTSRRTYQPGSVRSSLRHLRRQRTG